MFVLEGKDAVKEFIEKALADSENTPIIIDNTSIITNAIDKVDLLSLSIFFISSPFLSKLKVQTEILCYTLAAESPRRPVYQITVL